ncbi:MAG TPA: methyltransferase domain-containing protein [Candidatus Angelobacter sp.]|nr:methyltransferase domain-containing protein [Candidatus Angelobacter sp.]
MEHKSDASEFDRFAGNYADLADHPVRRAFAEKATFFHQRKIEVLLRALKKMGAEPSSLEWIDVGCGQGDLLKLGKDRFRVASGCDVSREMTQHCDVVPALHQTDPVAIPFADVSADLITAACVFHHVEREQQLALLRDIVRTLKIGGWFAMIEHNPWNPVTQWIVRHTPVDINAKLLFPGEAARLMRKAELRVEAKEFFLCFPEMLYHRCAAIESSLSKLPFGGQYLIVGRRVR